MSTIKITLVSFIFLLNVNFDSIQNNFSLDNNSSIPTKKKQINKLNKSLIFDLFLSYELSSQNNNSDRLSDYFSQIDEDDVDNISLSSSLTNSKEKIVFTYDDNKLQEIDYNLDCTNDRSKHITYELVYIRKKLIYINIGTKKKITFDYDSYGKITKIRRQKSGMWYRYNFTYSHEEDKVFIKLTRERGVKKRTSKKKHFAEWNENFELTKFQINNYKSDKIIYDETGNVISSYYSYSRKKDIQVSWKYKLDNENNWIEKKTNDATYTRQIVYN